MQPDQRSLRIDIAELKAQLVKRIGAEKSKQYFHYMKRFLSRSLSKIDFDKLCIRVLGGENLSFHNLFILSILKNASSASTPPASIDDQGPTKSAIQNGFLGGSHSPCSTVNGVILPISPKKSRSRRDRPNHFGINSIVDSTPHQTTSRNGKVVVKNGFLSSSDRVSIYSKSQNEAVVVEDREMVVKASQLHVSKLPLIAPLGIPFCTASIGGSCRALPVASSSTSVGYYDSGGLYGKETLKDRMEHIAAAQGLEGVSSECATLLNTMLDLYLKKLIESCADLTGEGISHKKQIQQKIVDGLWPSNHTNDSGSNLPVENMQDDRNCSLLSLLDFKVAMELNPHQLGENWPLLLEKICMRAFDRLNQRH